MSLVYQHLAKIEYHLQDKIGRFSPLVKAKKTLTKKDKKRKSFEDKTW